MKNKVGIKKHWANEETKKQIESRLQSGESLRSIAKSIGVCYQNIQYWRERWGLPKLKQNQLSGPEHPNWKGGNSVDKWGYRLLYAPERIKSHPYTYEHVLVAEKMIGRRLKRNEHVHHINEIKLDNRPENLLVCTASQHRTIHRQLEQLAIELLHQGKVVFRNGRYEFA